MLCMKKLMNIQKYWMNIYICKEFSFSMHLKNLKKTIGYITKMLIKYGRILSTQKLQKKLNFCWDILLL